MCLGAIYWAKIDRIYYGNNRTDARNIDFADDFIYDELNRQFDERTIPIIPLLRDEALQSFRLWQEKEDKTEYWHKPFAAILTGEESIISDIKRYQNSGRLLWNSGE